MVEMPWGWCQERDSDFPHRSLGQAHFLLFPPQIACLSQSLNWRTSPFTFSIQPLAVPASHPPLALPISATSSVRPQSPASICCSLCKRGQRGSAASHWSGGTAEQRREEKSCTCTNITSRAEDTQGQGKSFSHAQSNPGPQTYLSYCIPSLQQR